MAVYMCLLNLNHPLGICAIGLEGTANQTSR